MKLVVLLALLLVLVGCADDDGMTSLSLDELCGSMYEYELERIRVTGPVDGELRCREEECPHEGVTCNRCVTPFFFNCNGPTDRWDDGDVWLYAQEDINLPGVSLLDVGGERYFENMSFATKLGCVGTEDDFHCSPANRDDIVSVVGTVDVYGHLGVHEVEMR